jgi:putative sterol carrier protein
MDVSVAATYYYIYFFNDNTTIVHFETDTWLRILTGECERMNANITKTY